MACREIYKERSREIYYDSWNCTFCDTNKSTHTFYVNEDSAMCACVVILLLVSAIRVAQISCEKQVSIN